MSFGTPPGKPAGGSPIIQGGCVASDRRARGAWTNLPGFWIEQRDHLATFQFVRIQVGPATLINGDRSGAASQTRTRRTTQPHVCAVTPKAARRQLPRRRPTP